MKLILAMLMASGWVHGADLESVLDSAAKSKTPMISREQSFLVDTLRSLQEKAPTLEQSQFFRELEASEWENALVAYPTAFGGTEFARSANGQALEALLFFKAGLPVVGVEKLLTVSEPKKIHFYILNLWRESAPETHPAWSIARLQWSQPWTEVLGMATEVRVRAQEINSQRGIAHLSEMAKKAPTDSRERGLIEWNLALAYSMNDQGDQAAKIMASLLKSPNSPVSEDLIHLTAARLLFQSGYFEAAIRYYEKVPKNSDYWLEAQEEIAWSYFRRGQPQDAIAVTQTLVNPVFAGQVGAETHFVRALAQLRVCDYPGVAASVNEFPRRFKSRTLEMQKMTKEPRSPAVIRTVEAMKKGPLRWEDLGADSQVLPRMVTRDQRLRELVSLQVDLERESARAQELASRTPSSGESELVQRLRSRAQEADAAVFERVRLMAERELGETKRILDKLHIVEAELIQQTAMPDKVAKASEGIEVKPGTTGAKDRDVLRFPTGADVWFDELANYKVSLSKACQVRR